MNDRRAHGFKVRVRVKVKVRLMVRVSARVLGATLTESAFSSNQLFGCRDPTNLPRLEVPRAAARALTQGDPRPISRL